MIPAITDEVIKPIAIGISSLMFTGLLDITETCVALYKNANNTGIINVANIAPAAYMPDINLSMTVIFSIPAVTLIIEFRSTTFFCRAVANALCGRI